MFMIHNYRYYVGPFVLQTNVTSGVHGTYQKNSAKSDMLERLPWRFGVLQYQKVCLDLTKCELEIRIQ